MTKRIRKKHSKQFFREQFEKYPRLNEDFKKYQKAGLKPYVATWRHYWYHAENKLDIMFNLVYSSNIDHLIPQTNLLMQSMKFEPYSFIGSPMTTEVLLNE